MQTLARSFVPFLVGIIEIGCAHTKPQGAAPSVPSTWKMVLHVLENGKIPYHGAIIWMIDLHCGTIPPFQFNELRTETEGRLEINWPNSCGVHTPVEGKLSLAVNWMRRAPLHFLEAHQDSPRPLHYA